MAQYDGSIRIDTQLNTRDFERSSKNLISGMKRLGNSLNGIIGSIGFGLGIAGLVALGKQAIDTASDIQEVQNVVDTAFGSMSYKMEEFANKSVKQFGISQLSAKETGSTFMAMGAAMLDSMEDASNMAINLTARSADMASFFNKTLSETSTAAKSIYTGETETLKAYGVVMTEVNLQEYAATQGIKKKISAMTQAEKVQLRYNYFMEQTSLAAGDFAKTSGSWANQTRILSEQFKEFLSVLGTGLITVLTPVVKFLNTILTQLIAIAKQIGSILSKLFGISLPTADSSKFASDLSAAASGADDLANGMDAAGEAAEKAGKAASKALAPFDKLNVLSKDSDSNSGSGGGATADGGGFEMSELSFDEKEVGIVDSLGTALDGVIDRLKELKGLFVKGFFEGLGDWEPSLDNLKKNLVSIGKILKDIFTDPEVVSAANRFANQLSYSLGQVAGSVASIGLTIANLLVGGMEKYLTQNKDRIKQYIVSMLDISTEIAGIVGDFSVAFADIFSVFGGDTAQQIAGNLIGIFAEVGMMISENAVKLGRDILGMITQPIIDNKDEIKTALEGTLQAIEPFTSGLLTAVQTVSDAVSDVYDNHLKPLFDSITKGLSDVLGKLLDGYNAYIVPVLQGLGEQFKEIMEGPFGETIGKIKDFIGKLIDAIKLFWEEVLVPFFGWIADNIMPVLAPIIDFIGNTILTVFETIVKVVGDIADSLGGVIDFVTGVFTGDWKKAWKGINKFFKGTWDTIKDILDGVWKIIKNLVKNGVNFVKTTITTVWNAIKTVTSTVWNAIKTVLSTLWNILKTLVSTVFNAIKTTISTVWNSIKTVTSTVWNGIKTTVNTVWKFFKDNVSGIFNRIKTTITTVWNAIKKVTSTVWNGIKKTVNTVWNFFKNNVSAIFDEVKEKIEGVWDSIKSTTSTVWDGIKSTIKGAVNGIIGFINSFIKGIATGINSLIDLLNKFKVDIPKGVPLVGGKKLGFDLSKITAPQIPQLASGAVIRGGDPFLAVLGDQRHGQTNIEAPLDTIKYASKKAVLEVFSELGVSAGHSRNFGNEKFVFQVDGKTFFEITREEAWRHFNRTGRSPFPL